MGLLERYAQRAGMTDEAWCRHANPWSVWTRFAAIPLMLAAIWSRVWIGWWSLVLIRLVIAWLAWNPHAFRPVEEPVAWSSRGIYGERLWLRDRSRMPAGFAVVQRVWIAGAIFGAALVIWGLSTLQVWPTVFGATLLIYGQLWRIDPLGIFYEELTRGPD